MTKELTNNELLECLHGEVAEMLRGRIQAAASDERTHQARRRYLQRRDTPYCGTELYVLKTWELKRLHRDRKQLSRLLKLWKKKDLNAPN